MRKQHYMIGLADMLRLPEPAGPAGPAAVPGTFSPSSCTQLGHVRCSLDSRAHPTFRPFSAARGQGAVGPCAKDPCVHVSEISAVAVFLAEFTSLLQVSRAGGPPGGRTCGLGALLSSTGGAMHEARGVRREARGLERIQMIIVIFLPTPPRFVERRPVTLVCGTGASGGGPSPSSWGLARGSRGPGGRGRGPGDWRTEAAAFSPVVYLMPPISTLRSIGQFTAMTWTTGGSDGL
jgi:hypothetical protein